MKQNYKCENRWLLTGAFQVTLKVLLIRRVGGKNGITSPSLSQLPDPVLFYGSYSKIRHAPISFPISVSGHFWSAGSPLCKPENLFFIPLSTITKSQTQLLPTYCT